MIYLRCRVRATGIALTAMLIAGSFLCVQTPSQAQRRGTRSQVASAGHADESPQAYPLDLGKMGIRPLQTGSQLIPDTTTHGTGNATMSISPEVAPTNT